MKLLDAIGPVHNLLDTIGPVHNSHLTCFKRCPQKFKYKYLDNLQARKASLPLTRGIWTHYCLEAQSLRWGIEDGTLLYTPTYIEVDGVGTVEIKDHLLIVTTVDSAGDVSWSNYDLSAPGMLQLLIEQVYNKLFHLEQEALADKGYSLPEQVKLLLEGYFSFHGKSLREEKILYVECNFLREYLDTNLFFEGRIDLIVQDKRGRVIVRDWKTSKNRPGPEWKLMESQLHIYPWGIEELLEEHGLQVTAVEFDWLRSVMPTKPKQNQNGELSKAKIDTTPAVYHAALKEYGIEVDEYHAKRLAELEEGLSDYYYRQRMPRAPKVTKAILQDALATAQVMEKVVVGALPVTRTTSKDCTWSCEFLDLCQGELYGADVSYLRKTNFQERKTRSVKDVSEE